jgi:hypothetical protein
VRFSAQLRFRASSPHAVFIRNRCFHGFPFPPSEPAKLNPFRASTKRNQLAVDSCRTAEIERIMGAQNLPVCWSSQQTSPV